MNCLIYCITKDKQLCLVFEFKEVHIRLGASASTNSRNAGSCGLLQNISERGGRVYALPDAKVCVVCSVFAVGEREDAAYQLIIHNRSASQENRRSTQEYQSSMLVTFSLLSIQNHSQMV